MSFNLETNKIKIYAKNGIIPSHALVKIENGNPKATKPNVSEGLLACNQGLCFLSVVIGRFYVIFVA